ncbi:hypothetical protein NQ317_002097 [Molorchus minor]|uniref:Protein DPCD n=1 Tax=Molorchus minor TaxID=1323400 RepID=A0ABQ9JVK2_9CUCU|nr:hypothetical protein NQ317_002097 [Molorchus minor]
MTDWFSQLKKAKKSCIVDGKLKKVHFDFGDGREMVKNTTWTPTAWRHDKHLKGEDKWDIELGDPEPVFDWQLNQTIRENSNQPFISKRITKSNLEWRIRNMPYPIETYSVTADAENKCLIVRTTNKKYYKKLEIPDLDRLNLAPAARKRRYKKPKQLLDLEKAIWEEIKQVQPKNAQENMDCKPS